MANKKLDKEYADIKAGVEGMVGEVPAPSEGEAAPAAPGPAPGGGVEEEMPATRYAEGEGEGAAEEGAEEGYAAPGAEEVVAAGEEGAYYPAPEVDVERIHEVAEAVVNEKWQEFLASVGDIVAWKEKISNDIVSVKQEIVRIEERFESLQSSVLGRVKEYDEGMRAVHTEMKALEKVFERIVEPLVSNIKELGKITQELKKISK